jgi:copper chaperone
MFEIKVSGMTCGGCVKSITNAVKNIDSKANVAVNLNSQLVTIETEKEQSEMVQAIEDAGFSVLEDK